MRRFFLLIFILFSFQHGALAMENGVKQDFIGQWVWSSRDAKIFRDTRLNVPNLVPCIWVGTISVSDGKVVQRLANSPDLAGQEGPVAVVIRFDDSFNSVWGKKAVPVVAEELDKRLNKLTGILADSGTDVQEIQLDYDCPIRHLEYWSKVVRALKNGSLKGRDVWITSLPCHIQEPRYGSWFRSSVTGHILQVFDTGVSCDTATVNGLAGCLRKQQLAFRIGLGAFERIKESKSTDHRSWFYTLNTFSSIPEYRGVWVFPGGNRWDYLL